MRILLSNDDGIDAPGLAALERAMADLGELWVVAPMVEQSGRSHALTLHEPLRARQDGPRRFAVSGTPADCVYLAVHGLCPERPDLVVSGVNRGANLGDDVHYSGTVAAAQEGALSGVKALAVSLDLDGSPAGASLHFDTAARLAREVAARLMVALTPPHELLNLNCPNLPWEDLRGLRITHMGRRRYGSTVHVKTDPRGRTYYWLGGEHEAFDAAPDSDGRAIDEGYGSLTPLRADRTAHDRLGAFSSWAR